MPPRFRNVAGYPSTALGRARRLARAGVQKAARQAMFSAMRAPAARLVRGVERTGGFYGRFQGPGAETKFFDTQLAFTVDTTGEVPATGQLVLIPQGVTQSTRVGRKATLKSLQIRLNATHTPAGGANAASTMYLYVVQDTQCNGAAAAVTDVFTSASMEQALINIANSSRFRILKKWVMDFNSGAGVTTAYNNISRHVEFYKRLQLPIEYSSTTGAITEIRSNNVFLIAGAIGADDAITVSGTARVRFSDN